MDSHPFGKKVERYGPPDFSCEQTRVSIWIGRVPLRQMPENYFEENYADKDAPLTLFSEDFGFGFYDSDFVDANSPETGPRPLRELLEACSYADSFVDAAVAAADKLGLMETELVFLIYSFAYDPRVTGIEQSPYLRFLGCFDYER